jgi:hypothetical protein
MNFGNAMQECPYKSIVLIEIPAALSDFRKKFQKVAVIRGSQ